MIALAPPFRQATAQDAGALADLVEFASEGLALKVWSKIAGPGGDAWAIGRERAQRETGSFSYRNAVLVEAGGGTAARAGGPPPPGGWAGPGRGIAFRSPRSRAAGTSGPCRWLA